jgi:hypothetical protein
MNKQLKKLVYIGLLTHLVSASAVAAGFDTVGSKLEAFNAKTGVVMIRGFEKVGSIFALYGSQLDVESKEFINVSEGTTQYGITIELIKMVGQSNIKKKSYVDYDEIDSLIEGIDYITKISPSVTEFEHFQADYKTRGDLKVSIFSSNEGVLGVVTSGKEGGVSIYFKLDTLTQVKALLLHAKRRIDVIRG